MKRSVWAMGLLLLVVSCGSSPSTTTDQSATTDQSTLSDGTTSDLATPTPDSTTTETLSPKDVASIKDSGAGLDLIAQTDAVADTLADQVHAGDAQPGDSTSDGGGNDAHGDLSATDQSSDTSTDVAADTSLTHNPAEWVMCVTHADCIAALGANATCDRSVFPGGVCRGCNVVTDLCPKLAVGKVWGAICNDFGNCNYTYDDQLGCPSWLSKGALEIDGVVEELCGLKKCSSSSDCTPYECREFSTQFGDACQQQQ